MTKLDLKYCAKITEILSKSCFFKLNVLVGHQETCGHKNHPKLSIFLTAIAEGDIVTTFALFLLVRLP